VEWWMTYPVTASTLTTALLAKLLASPTWSGRILGTSGMGAWPNDRLWMATGNNLRIGGGIASRSDSIRLKPTAPHPEERTGFAIPDLKARIMNQANRGRLLERLLILVATEATESRADYMITSLVRAIPLGEGALRLGWSRCRARGRSTSHRRAARRPALPGRSSDC
jgi:hypothetical protein